MRFDIAARVRRSTGFTLEARFSCQADSVGVTGPSGSGKSTLLDAVAGIEPGARVVLGGTDLGSVPIERRGVAYVSQDPLLFPHLSVRANLLFSPRASDLGEVPDALGIRPLLDRMPRNLSGGERRRVALGRAILSRPKVLLLDEPFGGLDETRRRDAMSLLDRVRSSYRLPMVLVSHVAEELAALTDWTVRLEEGRVISSGPTVAALREAETRIDNYFEGEVVSAGRVRVEGTELACLLPERLSGRVRLACYAHDILLAREAPRAISARNVFSVRVANVIRIAEAVLVEIEKPALRALLTTEAATSLGLSPGTEAFAVVKATSVVYLGPA